jgi:FkbM family methyltransferase
MKRPLLLRLLPDRLRMAAWFHLYQPTTTHWHPLFQEALLGFAPRVSMELLPGDIISDSIAFTGIWELNLTRQLIAIARQGGTMVDIGANLGYFSLIWAASASANRCLSIEASPRNVAILRRNVDRNRFASCIEIIPKAAGKQADSLSFKVGPPEQTGWGGFASAASVEDILVEVVRVDEIFNVKQEIALLKIDIEGADTWALMGCEKLLKSRRIRSVWFEQNKPRMKALGIGEREAEEFLKSVGYIASPQSDPTSEQVEWSAVPG